MNVGFLLLPLSATVLGALILPLLVYLYMRPERLKKSLKPLVTDPALIQQVLPGAEEHVDYFLRKRLPEAMPMISMFIGDKTIGQLKGIFMEELKTLFPVFVESSLDKILLQGATAKKVRQQLTVKSILPGAAMGAAIGLIQYGLHAFGIFHSSP